MNVRSCIAALAEETAIYEGLIVELCQEDDKAKELVQAYIRTQTDDAFSAALDYLDGCF